MTNEKSLRSLPHLALIAWIAFVLSLFLLWSQHQFSMPWEARKAQRILRTATS
jgi:hypothetical protein